MHHKEASATFAVSYKGGLLAGDAATNELLGMDYKEVLRRQTISRAKRLAPFYALLSISFVMLIAWRYVPNYGMSLAFKDFSLQRLARQPVERLRPPEHHARRFEALIAGAGVRVDRATRMETC